jgi:hypothetical protein
MLLKLQVFEYKSSVVLIRCLGENKKRLTGTLYLFIEAIQFKEFVFFRVL